MPIKFGEWISVDEALPAQSKQVLVRIKEREDHGFISHAVAYVDYELNGDPVWGIIIYDGLFHEDKDCDHRFFTLCNIFQRNNKEIGIVTHWMPLPILPEDKQCL